MIPDLVHTVSAIADIPSEEAAKLCSIAAHEKISKGDTFIREGDTPQKFAFVGSGLFRYYYVNEKGYMKKEARERELLILNAVERYRVFLREYPDLEKRIKQHMIASYLGITPVALSRIRKEISSAHTPVTFVKSFTR